jgi:hypothetical protein
MESNENGGFLLVGPSDIAELVLSLLSEVERRSPSLFP